MDRVESYVFDISGDNNLYQSSSSDQSFSSPSSSSASSSIGRNSDDDDDGGDGEENEAESPYKGPLDLMESLEEVLPVRKGISSFYNGKSKSFTDLAAAEAASALTSSSSMKDLAKPENPYSRRRRNLLCHQIWEGNNKSSPRGGISKKHVMSSSRSALTLAMAVAAGVVTGEGSSSGENSSSGSSPTNSGSPPRQRHLPPLYPRRSQGSFGNLKSSQSSLEFCALRSYSVASGLGSQTPQ
ncbi:hypothetical protein Bca4012_025655 [Brassica carinata]|uniref:Uncharacterized protein n=1 Tax=Brassica carinata TaxID=52824 RepID=A0A8X7VGX4_BRACI|nr:hypothetical protein Bca52824_022761 [Brassica carinata]